MTQTNNFAQMNADEIQDRALAIMKFIESNRNEQNQPADIFLVLTSLVSASNSYILNILQPDKTKHESTLEEARKLSLELIKKINAHKMEFNQDGITDLIALNSVQFELLQEFNYRRALAIKKLQEQVQHSGQDEAGE